MDCIEISSQQLSSGIATGTPVLVTSHTHKPAGKKEREKEKREREREREGKRREGEGEGGGGKDESWKKTIQGLIDLVVRLEEDRQETVRRIGQ